MSSGREMFCPSQQNELTHKKLMKIFVSLLLLLALTSSTGVKANTEQNQLKLQRLATTEDKIITGVLDNIAGDTYYAKFTNSSSDTYRVYYKITDGDKTVQDQTSMVVQGNSSNSNGPYHCSSSAILSITKTEKI